MLGEDILFNVNDLKVFNNLTSKCTEHPTTALIGKAFWCNESILFELPKNLKSCLRKLDLNKSVGCL